MRFAAIAAPAGALAACLVLAIALADVPYGYVWGLLVAPALTLWRSRRRGTTRRRAAALALLSTVIACAALLLAMTAFLAWVGASLSDFD